MGWFWLTGQEYTAHGDEEVMVAGVRAADHVVV